MYHGVGDGTFEEADVPPRRRGVRNGPTPPTSTRDGHLDLVRVDSAGVNVLLGSDDGLVAVRMMTIEGISRGIAADADGDQIADLLLTIYLTDEMQLLRGHGDGTFADPVGVPAGDQPYGLVAGDVDGDEIADVLVGTLLPDVVLLRGLGGGAFAPPVNLGLGAYGVEMELVDVDLDGIRDLVGLEWLDVFVALGAGDGTFALAHWVQVGNSTTCVVVGDFDEDGIPDLFASAKNELGSPSSGLPVVGYLRGVGDGTFDAPVYTSVGTSVDADASFAVAGDFDGDGHLDVAVAVKLASFGPGEVRILLGQGDGSFVAGAIESVAGNSLSRIEAADVNGDQIADLVLGHLQSKDVWVLPGVGDGTFGAGEVYPTCSAASLVVGDWNGDLVTDVAAFCGLGDGIAVLVNQLLR